MRRIILACALASVLAGPAFGQGVDPLIGTWKFVNTNDGVDAQGQPFKIVFRHTYDGQPHPTTGSPNYDSTIFHRIGNSINAVRFKMENWWRLLK
jgi:hypothetical protein